MLFREDLEELLKLFNPTGTEGAIRISDSEAEYDSLDEMESHKGERIYHIKISSRKPAIVINLRARPKDLNLYTLESTDEADIAFFKTNEFLQPKRRPLNTYMSRVFLLLLLLTYFLVGRLPWLTIAAEKYHWLWLIYSALGLFSGVFVFQLEKRTALFVSLGKRHESLSFFERKKDDLLMYVTEKITSDRTIPTTAQGSVWVSM